MLSRWFRRKPKPVVIEMEDEPDTRLKHQAEIRREAFRAWLTHAVGTALSENPIPDILEQVKEHNDKLAAIGELCGYATLDMEPVSGCAVRSIEAQLGMVAQLRASLSPLERKLSELQEEYDLLSQGQYLRWLSSERDLLDYDPEKARDLLDETPHRKEDEES